VTCRELVELVTDYLDGALDEDLRVRFEEHLGECPACDVYLDQFRRTIASVGRLREDDVPAPVAEDLLVVFRGWKR
jgi:anti-sigma factor RsiW